MKIKECMIFATATNNRLVQVIDEANFKYEKIFLVVQDNRWIFFEKRYPNLNIIKTCSDYIEYKVLKKEKRIPSKIEGDILIPSSFNDNMNMFGEAISYALEIKCDRIIWKGITTEVLVKNGVREKAIALLIWNVYKMSSLITKIEKVVKGYKW